MQFHTAKSFATCALGVAVIAGCATQSTAPMASAQPSAPLGRVASIEQATAADMPTGSMTSGSSVAGTSASGSQSLVTMQMADGTQRRYVAESHSPPLFNVGDTLEVVKRGENTFFVRP
jgi:hypothetical protein